MNANPITLRFNLVKYLIKESDQKALKAKMDQ